MYAYMHVQRAGHTSTRTLHEHMMRVHVQRTFDEVPLEQQPSIVADTGCGDGTLLLKLYEHVKAAYGDAVQIQHGVEVESVAWTAAKHGEGERAVLTCAPCAAARDDADECAAEV